jgi:hypothetical protein
MPDLSIYVLPPAQNLGTPFFQTRGVFVTAIVPRGTRLVIFTRHTPVPHVNKAFSGYRKYRNFDTLQEDYDAGKSVSPDNCRK